MKRLSTHALVVCSIVAVSVIAYLPAVDNSFISDDFGIFPILDALEQNPFYIFDTTSELFRVMSYLYFWACFSLFGIAPAPYYWAGIALHVIVSVLVYFLVLNLTRSPLAGWAAALFFAAYERHQEAVMWISAANELVLTVWCVLFLLLWQRGISRDNPSRLHTAAALMVLALALFSKEAAVILAPMATIGLILARYTRREILEKSIPVFAMVLAFAMLWLSQADRNFFLTDGHYELGPQFITVYGRALFRLIVPAIPFAAAMVLLKRQGRMEMPARSSMIFFSALLVLAVLPYSFLTYLDHLPSRHTYFPSVGLAGVIGILFAAVHQRLTSLQAKRGAVAFLLVLVAGNAGYLWLKKEPQYRERAAPTPELIEMLNFSEAVAAQQLPIYVCGFPLPDVWWFGDAVARFTRFDREAVVLSSTCAYPDTAASLSWDPVTARYALKPGKAAVEEQAIEAAVSPEK